MTTDPETTRIVRSWLDVDGVTVLSDRVLDAVLDQLPTIPQRRPSPVRRFRPMLTSSRLAMVGVAAAAVFVASVFMAGPPRDDAAGPETQAPPLASPMVPQRQLGPITTSLPMPIPSDGAHPFPSTGSGPLPAGPYRVFGFAVPLKLALPDGWSALRSNDGSVALVRTQDGKPPGTVPNAAFLGIYRLDGVYRDPCHDTAAIAPAPTSLQGWVDALTHQVGFEAGPVTAQHLGVSPARTFDIVARAAAADCADQPPPRWSFASGPSRESIPAPDYASAGTERMWVANVLGTIILVDAQVSPDFRGGLDEVQGIVYASDWQN